MGEEAGSDFGDGGGFPGRRPRAATIARTNIPAIAASVTGRGKDPRIAATRNASRVCPSNEDRRSQSRHDFR